MIGYALYYFVRKNFNTAMPSIEATFGITKAQLGLFLTLNGIIYGLSRFINGFIADRVSARKVMSLGLALSALVNIGFGFSDKMAMLIAGTAGGQEYITALTIIMGSILLLNGYFQGMGVPPVPPLMTHWVPANELARKMSIWNMSHSIGAGLIFVMGSVLVHHFDNSAMAALFSHPCGVFASGCGRFVPDAARQALFGRAARTRTDEGFGRRTETCPEIGQGLSCGFSAPHGLRKSGRLGAFGLQFLRLHRPVLVARLGNDAPAPYQRDIGRRSRNHGGGIRIHRRKSGYGDRRMGDRPAVRQPRTPYVRLLYARNDRHDDRILEHSRQRLSVGNGHSIHADRLFHLRTAGSARYRHVESGDPRRRRPRPTEYSAYSVMPVR